MGQNDTSRCYWESCTRHTDRICTTEPEPPKSLKTMMIDDIFDFGAESLAKGVGRTPQAKGKLEADLRKVAPQRRTSIMQQPESMERQASPAHTLLCPAALRTATTPTSSLTDNDSAGHPRASSADNHSSSKRPVSGMARDPAEASPRLRKQRRVEGTPEKQAKEIRQLLGTERNAPSTVVLGEAPVSQRMTQAQVDRFRDIGLALIVMVSNSFDVSARTFVLSVKIFDRFLKGLEVLPPQQPPTATSLAQTTLRNCTRTGKISLAYAPQHGHGGAAAPTPPIEYEYEIPVACFIISCKFCETFAPRLTDTVRVIASKCTVEALRGAENRVLETLNWDVNLLTGSARNLPPRAVHAPCLAPWHITPRGSKCLPLTVERKHRTGLDVMHKLFSFTTPQRAAQIRSKAEMAMKVACCSRAVMKFATPDLAVGVLINACEEGEMGEWFLDFVPPFMLTDTARRCHLELRNFMLKHVQPHHREQQRREHDDAQNAVARPPAPAL